MGSGTRTRFSSTGSSVATGVGGLIVITSGMIIAGPSRERGGIASFSAPADAFRDLRPVREGEVRGVRLPFTFSVLISGAKMSVTSVS
jgi:hypothetical protein